MSRTMPTAQARQSHFSAGPDAAKPAAAGDAAPSRRRAATRSLAGLHTKEVAPGQPIGRGCSTRTGWIALTSEARAIATSSAAPPGHAAPLRVRACDLQGINL